MVKYSREPINRTKSAKAMGRDLRVHSKVKQGRSMVTGMASSKLRAGPDRRAVVPIAALPPDMVFEIFLCLPGKELWRLRAVCWSWVSFFSDPLFAAAHAARHPEPLIVIGYAEDRNNGVVFDIIDLSGRVIRRVKGTEAAAGFERVVSTHLDLICVAEGASGRCRVLNPGTGVVCALPKGLAVEHKEHEPDFSRHWNSVVIGQVASTGECKVLRKLDSYRSGDFQLYEIITLADSSHWRGKKAPPYTVELDTWSSVVVNGFVYFFSNEIGQQQDATPFRIGSFDFETEEWRQKIQGPPHSQNTWGEFSLAALNGCLVVVHRTAPSLNLWFLEDPKEGTWVMKNSIQVGMNYVPDALTVRPLLVLNDGRIVLVHKESPVSLEIFNPNGTSRDVAEIGPCTAIGLYTGNLLSLANGAPS